MGTFPRQIVISPEFGAGIVTWMKRTDTFDPYEIIEHPAFITAIEDGIRDELTIVDILIKAGFPEDYIYDCYWGGLADATVRTVHGPYIVTEYDGFESIQYRDEIQWRE